MSFCRVCGDVSSTADEAWNKQPSSWCLKKTTGWVFWLSTKLFTFWSVHPLISTTRWIFGMYHPRWVITRKIWISQLPLRSTSATWQTLAQLQELHVYNARMRNNFGFTKKEIALQGFPSDPFWTLPRVLSDASRVLIKWPLVIQESRGEEAGAVCFNNP